MPRKPKMSVPVTHEQLEVALETKLANHPTHEQLNATLANHPTKADLNAALANHPTHEQLASALANHPTNEQLAAALANHPTKADLRAELAKYATKADLDGWGNMIIETVTTTIEKLELKLNVDLARHVRASDEQHRSELAVVDEKYADLPARVAVLEKR